MMRTMMKMASVAFVTLCLFFCSVITSTDSQFRCDQYAAVGDKFAVHLNIALLKETDSLRWMYNKNVILNRKQDKFIKGTQDDIYSNGSLKLTNLKKSDAGEYTPEVYSQDGTSHKNLKGTHLCVLERLQKAEVKMACPGSKVNFTCIVGQQEDLKFEWLQNTQVLEKEQGWTLTKLAREVEEDSFTCRVSNPVSSVISEPVTQSCFKSAFPDKLFGISIWIFVAGGGGIVLVLIIVVIVCCVCTRQKKRMRLKDEGELRLEWTNPEQQQHQHQHQHQYLPHPPDHHRHHHQQQQPAGHTGPRQNRSRQHREQQCPRARELPRGHPQPNLRQPAQAPRPADNADDEQPPPLPQPRKKAPRTQRV